MLRVAQKKIRTKSKKVETQALKVNEWTETRSQKQAQTIINKCCFQVFSYSNLECRLEIREAEKMGHLVFNGKTQETLSLHALCNRATFQKT